VIRPPDIRTAESNLEESLSHELSHLYFNEKFGREYLPLWFNEGLAEKLSGERLGIQQGIILSNALWARKIIALSHIDSLLQFSGHRASLAYLQSFSAVLFLENRYLGGQKSWQEFLTAVRQTGWETALNRFTGMDEIDFEIKWYRWLKEKYRWFIIFNAENLIWIAMVIVLAGALYAVRYRNRQILENWEKEEMLLPESGEWNLQPPDFEQSD
ncbi:MAG: hypothetical protein WAN36_08250, partial [Calditrichia bacterium]